MRKAFLAIVGAVLLLMSFVSNAGAQSTAIPGFPGIPAICQSVSATFTYGDNPGTGRAQLSATPGHFCIRTTEANDTSIEILYFTTGGHMILDKCYRDASGCTIDWSSAFTGATEWRFDNDCVSRVYQGSSLMGTYGSIQPIGNRFCATDVSSFAPNNSSHGRTESFAGKSSSSGLFSNWYRPSS